MSLTIPSKKATPLRRVFHADVVWSVRFTDDVMQREQAPCAFKCGHLGVFREPRGGTECSLIKAFQISDVRWRKSFQRPQLRTIAYPLLGTQALGVPRAWSVRAGFPARPRLASAGNGVTYLGDARIPAAVEHVLNKGPKCSFQPRSTRPELLSHVHRFGQRVQEQDQQRAIGDGIDCLMRTVSDRPVPRPPLGFVVDALKERKLMVLTSDKEGGFVVLPEGMYQNKALEAVHKNFKAVHFCPKNGRVRLKNC
ncbi:hypothetical protein HPB52_018121 [Rhipicephalus sanguineus]|uniref:Tick transposon n=1 Tax=Rhipicephalus sanguineus TaxID=34632 RepID=A0A9D4SN37_RHISA|nr:hypothetical protein HPB52_018121 [Rhipicephalus sanguineus]